MFKKRNVIFILLICLVIQSVPVNANSLGYFDERINLGKVVEIIDGEVINAYFYGNNFEEPRLRTIKLVGIDTDASQEALEYVSNRLLGHTVYFVFEENEDYTPDTMTHANVFYDFDKSVSEELLELGYAKVDTSYRDSEHYQSFLKAQANAQLYEEGIWATNLSKTSDRININKANSTQLMDALDIELELANKVYRYRTVNRFNDITEIMAVDEYFDAKWFEEHRHLLSVITNINKASYLELTSLIGTSSDVQKVIDEIHYYTRFNEVKSLDELSSLTYFHSYYKNVVDFLTLETTNVYEEEVEHVVNINTTNSTNFQTATGLKDVDFTDLKNLRKDGYKITTLGELTINGKVYTKNMAYHYSEHLNAYTDINNASIFELSSLFDQTILKPSEKKVVAQKIIDNRPYNYIGKLDGIIGKQYYDVIKPYIYVYEDELEERYNINTIDEDDKADFDKKYDNNYTKYTNINTATVKMIEDLDPDIYFKVVDEIIAYRNKHDFRYEKDLEAIFASYNQRSLYEGIRKYIVFE